jgi:hypothetical protein
MKDRELINNISEVIISYQNSSKQFGFENFVLEKLNESKEIKLFRDIWSTTISFENWNYEDLEIGFNKTVEILKSKYGLDERVSIQLANAAAYEWK